MRSKLLVVLVATLSGCWLFEVADLTHPIEAGVRYWAPCAVYLDESVKMDNARHKDAMDLHDRAWLDCIQRQHNSARPDNAPR